MGTNNLPTLTHALLSLAISACGHTNRQWKFHETVNAQTEDAIFDYSEFSPLSDRQTREAQAATRTTIDAFLKGLIPLCGDIDLHKHVPGLPIIVAPELQPPNAKSLIPLISSLDQLPRPTPDKPVPYIRLALDNGWVIDGSPTARLTCTLGGLMPPVVIQAHADGGIAIKGTAFPEKKWQYDVLWTEDGMVRLVDHGLPIGLGAAH